MGPIWATLKWANPYGTHAEPGGTPHMGSPYGTHIGMFAGIYTCCYNILLSVNPLLPEAILTHNFDDNTPNSNYLK